MRVLAYLSDSFQPVIFMVWPIKVLWLTCCICIFLQATLNSCNYQVGELRKTIEEGKIKYIVALEANASTIRRAHAVHPINSWNGPCAQD